MDQTTSYDELPYDSHPYERTHPDNLAAHAQLFGMQPPDPAHCRILELGCASGGNLIPMAVSLPNSELVGIDLSKRQITDGQETIDALKLKNVRLQAGSIMDFNPEGQKFDYILCHGVYSWVDRDVQDGIMQTCRDFLSPQGVAYISYNTNPGWYMRQMVRQMMCYHARQFDSPETQVEQARALLDFLINTCPESDPTYHALLIRELEIIRGRQDSYLYHEHLEEVNEPLFFYQFNERAEAHGLRYLSEAQFSEMVPRNLSSKVESTLARLNVGLIHSEQYLDFLRNRTFRRTLLCLQEVELQRGLGPEQLKKMYVSTPIRAISPQPDLLSGGEESFQLPGGGNTASVSDPQLKRVLVTLGRMWPKAVPVTSLPGLAAAGNEEVVVRDADKMATDLDDAAGLMLELFSRDMAELRVASVRYALEPGEKPTASSLARYQAQQSPWVTNLRHDMTQLSDLSRHVLKHLDGTNGLTAIVDQVIELASSGKLVIEKQGQPVMESEDGREFIETLVQRELTLLAGNALLLG